jgi:hypothetical protein
MVFSLTNHDHTSPHILSPVTLPNFLYFTAVTNNEVSKLFSQSPDTNCDLDPIQTSFFEQCSSVFLPVVTKIVNLSISIGVFLDQFQSCSVHPHLIKV